jgi:hypothetical protein
LRRPAAPFRDSRRFRRRPLSVTVAAFAVPSVSLRSCRPRGSLGCAPPFCGPPIGATHRIPLLLSALDCRAANCHCTVALSRVAVECPAPLFRLSDQSNPSVFGWLFTTTQHVICWKMRWPAAQHEGRWKWIAQREGERE